MTIMVALVLMLASIGAAFADHKGTEDHGPPGDPPCEQGQAGAHNPNCDGDDGDNGDGHGPPGNPPCDRGNAGQKNPNCPDGGNGPGNGNGPDPEPSCEGGIELEVDGVLYSCVFLLDPDANVDDVCPEGLVPVVLDVEPADQVVVACVTVVPDDGGDGNGDAGDLGSLEPPALGTP